MNNNNKLENSPFSHNVINWRQSFNKLKDEKDFDGLKNMRKEIMEQTKMCCENKVYYNDLGQVRHFNETPNLTYIHYDHNTKFTGWENTERGFTQLCVYQGDCLAMALKLKVQLDYNPVVLNMASEKSPGGAYKYGAAAQEENLFRRTNYYQGFATVEHKAQYPLSPFSGVYSPSVTVFRDTEENGYAFLSKTIEMSFVAMSAYNKPAMEGNRLSKDYADNTKEKIRIIFHIALEHNHDSIVLSALGCGAYKNPPRHIAELFKEVLLEDPFCGKFKVVVFAIYDDLNTHKEHNPEGNFKPFLETFGNIGHEYLKVEETEIIEKSEFLESMRRMKWVDVLKTLSELNPFGNIGHDNKKVEKEIFEKSEYLERMITMKWVISSLERNFQLDEKYILEQLDWIANQYDNFPCRIYDFIFGETKYQKYKMHMFYTSCMESMCENIFQLLNY